MQLDEAKVLLSSLAARLEVEGEDAGKKVDEALKAVSDALRTDADAPFLVQAPGPDGRGVVGVFAVAFDLDWSDLPARPAFVPVLQELVRRGSGLGMDATVVAGRPPGEDASIDRWSHDAELSAGPQPGGGGDLGSRAGVLLGVGRDGAVLRSLAVNPDAAAAVTKPLTTSDATPSARRAAPGV